MITLADLEGVWDLTRLIEDRRAGVSGRFKGTSVWAKNDDGLTQMENGVLSYGTAPSMQASRRYLWHTDGDTLHVSFDDGRPFHFVPEVGAEALHNCPPDTYRVRYVFEGTDQFTTRWHVTGPRKDAILTSTFLRK